MSSLGWLDTVVHLQPVAASYSHVITICTFLLRIFSKNMAKKPPTRNLGLPNAHMISLMFAIKIVIKLGTI